MAPQVAPPRPTDPSHPAPGVQVEAGPGFELRAEPGSVAARIWWSPGTGWPVFMRPLQGAIARALAAHPGARPTLVLDLREAPIAASRAVRQALGALLEAAHVRAMPVRVCAGPTTIQQRDLAELIRRHAPSACLQLPPPLPEPVAPGTPLLAA